MPPESVRSICEHPVLKPSQVQTNPFCRLVEIVCDGKHSEGAWVTPVGRTSALRLLAWIACGCRRAGGLPDIRKVGWVSFEVAGADISRGIGGIKRILGLGVFQRHLAFKQSFPIGNRQPSYSP